MDEVTAIKHLEKAILHVQTAIEQLRLLDGMEWEIATLSDAEADMLAQLVELEGIEE